MEETITTKCKICGKEFSDKIPHQGPAKSICPQCTKDKVSLFYSYNIIRYELWKCIGHNKKTAIEMYNAMCDEEGVEWTNKVLGDKLVAAIHDKNIY